MNKSRAVFIGFIGKLPLAGMALANVHYIAGLQSLGYEVHYVERQNVPGDCYDPATNLMTDSPGPALRFLEDTLSILAIDEMHWSFIDHDNRCHGSGWARLREVLAGASFVLNISDPTWFDELEICPNRAFVDTDPMFTQVEMMSPGGRRAQTLAHYPTLFTEGVRIGATDCAIPAVGRQWIPTRPVVATQLLKPEVSGKGLPVTTLMNWRSGPDFVFEGRTYGYKDREFEKFVELPRRFAWPCVVAMGGPAPRQRLKDLGWQLKSALEVTRTLGAYEEFIAGSSVDFGVVKHTYVESRCGCFSDRSLCYMAAGRPVLHQDTGFDDWLPVGRGVLKFSNLAELVAGLRDVKMDYTRP